MYSKDSAPNVQEFVKMRRLFGNVILIYCTLAVSFVYGLYALDGGFRPVPSFPRRQSLAVVSLRIARQPHTAGKLRGFKIKGQGYKDAIIPNDKNVDAPFLVKESK